MVVVVDVVDGVIGRRASATILPTARTKGRPSLSEIEPGSTACEACALPCCYTVFVEQTRARVSSSARYMATVAVMSR